MAAAPQPAPALDLFVARQPIFTSTRKVFGYELLYRAGPVAQAEVDDAVDASISVMYASLFGMGLDALADGKQIFVNFSRDGLLRGLPAALPSETTVVEVLEDVEPTDEVVAACSRLRSQGYLIALDDFTPRSGLQRLLDVADIVKVDFLETTPGERRPLARELAERGVHLLAETVETEAEFEEALESGYLSFQGYFFARPTTFHTQTIPHSRLQGLRLLREINRPELELNAIDRIVSEDVTLAYRLLRYVNSVAFGLRHQVKTIRHALLMLGMQGVRQWASIAVLAGFAADMPDGLLTTSVLRARLSQAVGEVLGSDALAQDAFLAGLFSLLDAIVLRPLDELLDELVVSDGTRMALLGGACRQRTILDLVMAYERGDWASVSTLAGALGLDERRLPGMYAEALRWANQSAA